VTLQCTQECDSGVSQSRISIGDASDFPCDLLVAPVCLTDRGGLHEPQQSYVRRIQIGLLDILLTRGDVRGAVNAALPGSRDGAALDRESADQPVAMRAGSAAQSLGDDAAYGYFLAFLPKASSGGKILKAADIGPAVSTRRQAATWSLLLDDAIRVRDDCSPGRPGTCQPRTCDRGFARLVRPQR